MVVNHFLKAVTVSYCIAVIGPKIRYICVLVVLMMNVYGLVDVDQLNQILSVLGTPDDETLSRIGSDRAQMYIRSLPQMPKIPFVNLYSSASELGSVFLHGHL